MNKEETLEELKKIRAELINNDENLMIVRNCAEALLKLLENDNEDIIQEPDNIMHGASELLELKPENTNEIKKQVDKFIMSDLNYVISFTKSN